MLVDDRKAPSNFVDLQRIEVYDQQAAWALGYVSSISVGPDMPFESTGTLPTPSDAAREGETMKPAPMVWHATVG